mgnify:CR=1 FL=1
MRQSKKPVPTKSFEERLKRLEEISSGMKEGGIPLEEAVNRFEEGIRLAASLEKDLSRIERRIEILVNSPEAEDEKPELELFSGLDQEEEKAPDR